MPEKVLDIILALKNYEIVVSNLENSIIFDNHNSH